MSDPHPPQPGHGDLSESLKDTLPLGQSSEIAQLQDRFHHYQLIEPIGQGGMGVVYRA